MKKNKITLFIVALICGGPLQINLKCFAEGGGAMGGHGGIAVVCRDIQGRITRAETLDLFEGRNQFGLRYTTDSIDPDLLIELAQLKLISSTEFLSQFRKSLNDVRSRLVFLPGGVGLQPTNDAFPVINRKGCGFEQLANYQDDELKVYVDREIFQMLSEVDQAAFLIHETIYKMARDELGETSSVRSRRLTAFLLAQNVDQEQIESLINFSRTVLIDGHYEIDNLSSFASHTKKSWIDLKNLGKGTFELTEYVIWGSNPTSPSGRTDKWISTCTPGVKGYHCNYLYSYFGSQRNEPENEYDSNGRVKPRFILKIIGKSSFSFGSIWNCENDKKYCHTFTFSY